MAPFNPQTPFGAAVNTIGASKGQIADTSLGTLFSGAGKLAEQGVATAEQRTQNQITSEVNAGVDAIDEELGVPFEVTNAVTKLDLLVARQKQGMINPEQFSMLSMNLLKKTRMQHPKWREFIDKALAKNGLSPANFERNRLMQEFRRGQTQIDRDNNRKLNALNSVSAQELRSLNPTIDQALAKGDVDEAMRELIKARAPKANYDIALREAFTQAQGRESQERVTSEVFNKFVPDALNSMLDSNIKSLGNGKDLPSGWVGLQRLLQSTGPESVEKINEVWNKIDALYLGMQAEIDNYGRTSVTDDPNGQTVFDVLGPKKFNEMKEAHLAPFTSLLREQGIRTADGQSPFNAILGAATRMKLNASKGAEQLQKEIPNLAAMAAFNEATSGIMKEIMLTNSDLQDAMGTAWTQAVEYFLRQPAPVVPTDGSEPANTHTTMNYDDPSTPLTGKQAKQRLTMWTAIVEGKKVPTEMKKNFLDNMFSAGNSARLFLEFKRQGLTRQEVLVQMGSHEVSKVMVDELFGTRAYNNYKNFMIEGAWLTQDVRDAVTDLNEDSRQAVDQSFGQLFFDDTTGRFDSGLTRGGTEGLSPEDDQLFQSGTSVGGNTVAYQHAVDRMNVIMSLFDPIAEAEGKSKAQFYSEVFQAWNVKFSDTPVSPLIQRMEEAIGEFFTKDSEETETKSSSSSFSPEEDQSILSELISFDAEDNAILSEDSDADKLSKILDIGETGGSGSYDVILGNTQNTFFPEGLTNTSVANVIKVGSARGKGSMLKTLGQNSTAMGRFQIVGKTLRGLVTSMGIDTSKKFDKDMQDSMFKELLRQRGFEKFLNGDISLNDFVKEMQKEWHGFAVNREAKTKLIALLMSIQPNP